MKTVRPMQLHELPIGLPLVQAYLVASQLPIPFNGEKVLRAWASLYTQNRGQWWGLWSEHLLVGIFCAHVIESMFGDAHAINEWVWWVEPDHRAGEEGIKLLEAGEEWARCLGMPLVAGAYDVQRGKVMARWYERRGYLRQGSIFIWFPEGGAHV